jgi:GAF domain-containing protein
MAEYDFQPGRATPKLPELNQAQSDVDTDELQAGLIGLAGLVVDALTVDELLTQVVDFAAHAIPGVDGAGVAVVHPTAGRLRIQARAVTTEFVGEIDALQYEVHNEGPCITSMRTRRPCISGSIGHDTRWPNFGGAVARLGVHSALSLPLVLGQRVIGSINAYAHNPDTFDEYAVGMGTKFAGPAAAAVHNARLLTEARHRAEQLQQALGSRSVIDQAIGIIRGRTGANAEEAFGRLVRISQSENIKLHVIAERLVDETVRRARAHQDHYGRRPSVE